MKRIKKGVFVVWDFLLDCWDRSYELGDWLDKRSIISNTTVVMWACLLVEYLLVDTFNLPRWIGGLAIFIFWYVFVRDVINQITKKLRKRKQMRLNKSLADGKMYSKKTVDALKPAPVYPTLFPCRIDESSRTIHCPSCQMVPQLMAEIASLKGKLTERRTLG